MNGFTGRRGPVIRCPGAAPATAAGAAGARGAGGGGAGPGPENRGMAWGLTAGGAGAAGAETAAPAPDPAAAGWAATEGAGGVASAPDADTANTLLHTAQRARTPPAGILAGSTRYSVPHAGQVTFTAGRLRPARGRGGGRPRKPTPAASWRNSSFPWRARLSAPGGRTGGAGW